MTIRARGENRGCTHYGRVRIHPNEDATSQCRKTEHATMIAYAGLIASTPPRLKSRGPATCPCDRVRRLSASASADGESLKSPAVFPGQHSSRAWRKDRSAECQSASVYPFKRERGAPTKVQMMSTSWETCSSSSAYRSSSSSGLTMSLTCSYRSKIVGLVVSSVEDGRCRGWWP